jgi:hypothetical protein
MFFDLKFKILIAFSMHQNVSISSNFIQMVVFFCQNFKFIFLIKKQKKLMTHDDKTVLCRFSSVSSQLLELQSQYLLLFILTIPQAIR